MSLRLAFETRLEWELDWGVEIRQIHEFSEYQPVSPDRVGSARHRWLRCRGQQRAVTIPAALATPQALPKRSGEKVLLTIDP